MLCPHFTEMKAVSDAFSAVQASEEALHCVIADTTVHISLYAQPRLYHDTEMCRLQFDTQSESEKGNPR